MPRRPRPIPDSVLTLAARQAGLVSFRQCTAHGMRGEQVAARVRARDWARVARGVYDTRTVPEDPGVRRRRAAVLGPLAHPGAVATGVCALVLHGVQGSPSRIVPEVAMPTGAPRAGRPPVRLRRTPVDRWETVDGLRVALAGEALVQALPELRRFHAVALMDSMRHRGLLDDAGAARVRGLGASRPGIARTHGWWEQSDERAESPAETWARLSCTDAGFPPDALQLLVASANGTVVARVDLAWRLPDGAALLVEIDGQDVHSTPEAVFADRARQNRLTTRRTIVRRFTGADAWRGRVGAAVGRELVDAGWRPSPVPPSTVYRLP